MDNKPTNADEENVNIDLSGSEQKLQSQPRRYQRRRQSTFVPDYIDWKDVEFLRRFTPERGKIMPRRISNISAKDQRRVSQAIKRARSMALIPFVTD